ncbi:MAG: hypothetical protein ABIC40_01375 [bacterium]
MKDKSSNYNDDATGVDNSEIDESEETGEIEADEICLERDSCQVVEGENVTMNSSAAFSVLGDDVELNGSAAFIVKGEAVRVRDSFTFILAANEVEGKVTTLFTPLTAMVIGGVLALGMWLLRPHR